MKTLRKSVLVSLALAMILGLSACGGSGASTPTPTAAPSETPSVSPTETTAQGDGSLDYILKKGTLIVGFDDAFPPFSFQADDGSYTGFDLDLAAKLAERWGVKIVYQPVAWSSKEQELNSKSIDIIWSGLGISDERLSVMNMSIPYAHTGGALITKKDSGIKSLADCSGKVAAMQAGNGYVMHLSEDTVNSFSDIVYQDTTAELLMQLDVGGADFVICDGVSAAYSASQSGYDFEFIPIYEELGGLSNYAVGCRLGEQDLLDAINKELIAMDKEGILTDLSNSWFGQDYSCVKESY